jgi:polar amino acid transport system substrate-binding protein
MRRLLMTCSMFLLPLTVSAGDLVILVGTGTEMPMARFENYKVVAGIHHELGNELARRMHRTPKFLSLPRKRMVRALEDGAADVLCSYMPEWLDGTIFWSQAFIPIVEVLIADINAVRPREISDLADKPIGTVLGYKHPELEAVLGEHFVRADAPTTDANLRKLAVGRVQYAVTGKSFLDWRLKQGDLHLALHPPLVVKTYMGRCAVSPKGRVKLADVDRAITDMVKDGTVNTILAHYQ